MDKIYLKDNYIVTELGGITAVFPKNYSSYSENTTGFYINSTFPVNNQRTVFIDFTRVTSVYNEAGTVAYSIATLRSFLLLNTGFKSPSGGSGGSTITVGTTPVTSGTDGRVFFQSGGVVQQDSNFFWDNTNKRFGVGTTPLTTLHIKGSATSGFDAIRFQSQYSTVGFLGTDNSRAWLSSGTGQGGSYFAVDSSQNRIKSINTVFLNGSSTEIARFGGTMDGFNIGPLATPQARLDIRAQGALSTDLILRTRNSADTRNFLVVNGAGDVYNNGAGGVTSNTFYGENVGRSASGTQNTVIGNLAGSSLTSGGSNSFFGTQAGQVNTTGANNTFIGNSAGRQNLIGTGNSYIGHVSGLAINSGAYNIALGALSGRYINGGANLTIANNSVFLGYDTRANADNETNQIVIGFEAIGTGSNSVTLGNTSITRTNLRGQVVISGFASAPTGVEGAIYYDTTTKKHYGFDGTNWNALY